MSLVAPQSRRRVYISLGSALRNRTHLALALIVAAGVGMVIYGPAVTVKSREITVVRAEGRGKGIFNFRDGRVVGTQYRGSERGVTALRSGQAAPVAVEVADLDLNGTPDLISGFSSNGIGLVTVQKGNPDAYAPADDSVFVRIQQGYNPEPLIAASDVYEAPIAIKHLTVGNFNEDSQKDVLIASVDGGAYLMKGDGRGNLGAAEQLTVTGTITALGTGEYGAADGYNDVALGVSGANGPVVQLFDATTEKFEQVPTEIRLGAPASAIKFGNLDDDGLVDIAVAAGNQITILHGTGRKNSAPLASRIERIELGYSAIGVAIGHFVWDRGAREELAVLSEDGAAHIIARDDLDTRPYTEADRPTRSRVMAQIVATKSFPKQVDIETIRGWQPTGAPSWAEQTQTATGMFSPTLFQKIHMSTSENDDLLIGGGDLSVRVIHTKSADEKEQLSADDSDLVSVSLDASAPVVASVVMPKKINGEGGLVLFTERSSDPTLVPLAVTAVFDVDTTTDNAALTACTGAAGDCSLRGAVTRANTDVAVSTINVPAGTYVLSINGTSNNGCEGNTVGDLDFIESGTTIVGAGAATTVIRQSATGPAPGSARVMCLNVNVVNSWTFSASGITVTGGRQLGVNNWGGGGIIAGAKDNTHTFTSVIISNNQATDGISPGGGIEMTGGNVTFTTCTFGGTSDPGADRTIVAQANSEGKSGGGLYYTPTGPVPAQGGGGPYTLMVTGTTFSRNTANSVSGGGGGAALEIVNFGGGPASGTATFTSNTQFNNNRALSGQGGGLIVASLPATVSGASFTSNQANAASGQGGGIYVGSSTLHLDGTSNAISFTTNTASPNGGSSISVNNATTVSGTLLTIGGDVVVNQQGSWTNNNGSTLAPTNFLMFGGTFTGNNATMNVTGNLTVQPSAAGVGTTFNAGSGTMNVTGPFSFSFGTLAGQLGTFNAGSRTFNLNGNFSLTFNSALVTAFTGGTSTFNFNGTGAQSFSTSLAATLNNLTNSNVTNPLTANNSFNVGGTLNVNGANAIFDPVAGAVIGGAGTLTGNGTARTRAAGGFSPQYTITTKTLTNLTVEYIGAVAQTGSAITYGPLKINNGSGVNLAAGTATVDGLLTLTTGALGVGNQTLVINNGSSVTGGSITSNPTGTVNYNQGSAGQDVRAFNYGNLTFSGFNKVLASTGTIGISGTFTPGAAVGHTITGSTVNFNGTGAQTVPAFSFNNLTISGAHGVNNVTLVNGGTINVAGNFTPSATFAGGNYIVTNNTMNFNGSGVQTIPAFNYFNLTSSNTGARALQNSGTIGVQSVFTPGTNTYTVVGSTVSFNGTALQSIPALPGGTAYNNLNLSNAGGANIATNITVGGTLSLTGGAFGVGTNTLTLNGAVTRVAGTLTSDATGTVNYNQGSPGQATVLSADYGNLTFSNFSKTLSSTGVIRIAGVFTPGTGTGHTITGSTIEFSSASPQNIPGFTYNNLTSSSTGTRTLDPVNTIKIAGAFTPGTNVYTITGSTVEYNGTSAQTLPSTFGTYNNLTLNNAAGVTGFPGLTVQNLLRVAAGTFTSSSSYNNVQIDAGATLAGVNATTINVSGNWTNNGGTFTPNGNTVNFTGTAAQAIDGTSATQSFGNITVNKGSNGVTVGGSTTTLNINGTLLLTAGTFTAGTATAINISGDWTNNTGSAASFVPGSSTVTFNNTVAAQAINGTAASQSFNHFAVNKTAQTLNFGGSTTQLDVVGNFTLTSGTFTAPATVNIGSNLNVAAGIFNAPAALNLTGNFTFTTGTFNGGATFNILGNWTNNGGTFNGGTGLVSFNGAAGQTISGTTATTFNNLTANDALGIAMSNDNTVNGILALTAGDITVAATRVLTQPAAGSSTGTFDVVGSLRRTGFVSGGAALSFGNPFNSIQINSGTAPTDITVNLVKTTPPNPIGYPNAVQRTYTISQTGGAGIAATLRLHYLDAELNGNIEGAGLNLWRFIAPMWRFQTNTAFDTTDNWVEKNGISSLAHSWTMNSTNAPTATNGLISGTITNPDGSPVAGAVVRLIGTQNRKTITNAQGGYQFTGVETSGFYTVVPSRANYSFSPAERSFNQVGETTEASFSGASSGDSVNPVDTAEYFVRQQYLDLLGREPDEGGFNYWSDRILECGADSRCVSARRRDVAAAFFIEQEFQQTGSFIYGLYKGALGRVPAYAEFSTDRTGLVVGPQLDALKQAYAESFVGRPEFVSRYAANTTGESFVDALLANVLQGSGVDLSSQRAALITRYNAGTTVNQSRSFAVRELTANAAFQQAEYNSAFVLTEYFGYLRRDPDAGGYAFWLNVLNNRDPGNFRGMVCAFITSAEYQLRFSAVASRTDRECGQ